MDEVRLGVRSGVSATELRRGAVDPTEWDEFAQRCEASINSAYAHMTARAIKHRLGARLRLFEISIDDGEGATQKVGQCAVSHSGRRGVFLDRLQLLPAHESMWSSAMLAVLGAAGSGRYLYGWELNVEQSRSDDIAHLPGARVDFVQPITVHAVDFSRWSSWDEYYHATSNNVRRNVAKSVREIPDLSLRFAHGFRSLTQVPALVRLRAKTHHRKGLDFHALKAMASSTGTILRCRRYVFTVLAIGDGRVLSAFSGYTFGTSTYYTDGGSVADNKGAAWYLLMKTLKRAYDRNPTGKFIMGYVDYAIHDESIGGGLLRSRRSCRVTDYDTSIVRFHWSEPQD